MLFLLKTFLTLLALLATCVLLPQLPLGVLRFLLRCVGWAIQKRTRSRREYLVSRVRADEEEQLVKRAKSSPRGEDEDWEKVDSSSSSSGTAGLSKKGGNSGNKGPKDADWGGIVGFFHPFCNAGGGGERVLWEAVRATQRRWPKAICAIYTGDHEVNKAAMLERVEASLPGLCMKDSLTQGPTPADPFQYSTPCSHCRSALFDYAQSLGSLVVAYDAFNLLVPDVFIDTMGYAFTLAFCKMLFPSVPTGAYVHYPTISTDMLQSLDDSTGLKGVNAGAGKGFKGQVKRKYWLAFARLYGWVGGHVDVVMCNSSWTSAHIRTIWGPARTRRTFNKDPVVIFPPTAVSEIESTITVDADSERSREPIILYIAQFRPEKNHPLVLRSFARFLNERKKNPASAALPQPKLVLIGSVRHASPDETHIYNLRLLAHELRIRDHTTFICDASWPTILSHLRSASVGVNAMWNEHFGICVVEYQAAGLISVVHDSGGPREDIVIDLGDGATGFRASTEDEFAAAFEAALALPAEEKVAMRRRARKSALRFTEEEFSQKWLDEVGKLVEMRRR
ncbi:hypothetical protein CNMCM6106_003028 [Aspergillus hiratsukae]|uniref:GDP-Man:Man(3)GlcNAc(2)-PP-Dol alpha-1,2-mannosyltransferase n=1 Tax=Aspergillus hiratsukae TaxID=1194566 RepID=A0A8H6Q6X2_9EURO|nr:hypothetical protein CNMCM6106_003028 [Aspergillus hiratsukae]